MRQHAEAAVRLVRAGWDEITELESVAGDSLSFDIHDYVDTLATEPDERRIPEEAIDDLMGLSTIGESKTGR